MEGDEDGVGDERREVKSEKEDDEIRGKTKRKRKEDEILSEEGKHSTPPINRGDRLGKRRRSRSRSRSQSRITIPDRQ